MSLPWSAQQKEWLREMGFEVLTRRVDAAPPVSPANEDGRADLRIPPALIRAARGVDLMPLLADGVPRHPAARRALWRALRPLRKAARAQ